MYSEPVLDHFSNPRNAGAMPDADGVGQSGEAGCGDVVKIFIKVRDNTIFDIKFQTFGCGTSIATSSMVTELVKGRSLEEARAITNFDVADALGGLPPDKMRCSNLAADAMHLALEDYERRRNREVG